MAFRVHVDVFGGDAGRQKTITNLLSVGAIDAVAKRWATFAQLRPSRHDVRDKSVIVHLVAKLLAVVVAASDRHARKIGMRRGKHPEVQRTEEHTSELQSLMRTSYAVFCLKK